MSKDTASLKFSYSNTTFIDQQDIKDCLSRDFFTKFTIVIATELDEPTSLTLSKILHDLDIPLILVRSIGFVGSFRIIVPEHTSLFSSRRVR
jgi:hypothetical protein